MRKHWLAVCILLGATSLVQAQQYPGYYNPNYYSANPYYGYPQTPAQRYSYPRPSGGYYAAPSAPGYYGAPRYNYAPYYPTAGARNAVAQPASQSVSSDPAVDVLPPGTLPSPAPMLPAIDTGLANPSRHRRTFQSEEFMPSVPAPLDRDRGNVSFFFDKVCTAMSPGSPEEAGAARQRNRCMWVSTNYQASFIRPMPIAGALVTTGSFNDAFPGSIGQPTTAVLFGSQSVNFNLASGANVTFGVFLDGRNKFSIESSAFAILPGTQSFLFQGDNQGNPLITRPVFALDQPQGAFEVSVPTLISGSTRIDISSQVLGGEINGRYHGCLGSLCRYDFLLGARYVRLSERLTIQDNYQGINDTMVLYEGNGVNSIRREDSFATENHFLGAQLGARLAFEHRWLYIDGFAKLGLGATMQQINISGYTTGTNANGSQTAAGGILALPTNIGTYNRTVFGVLPELGMTFGLSVTDNLRVQLGYSTLLWNGVARPGHQYSTAINSALAPSARNFGTLNGPVAPTFHFNDELFWVHSLNLGLQITY